MSGERQRKSSSVRSSAVGADDALQTLVNQFSDPLVFLRELVQNSLDAASTRIDVDFAHDPAEELMTITVADNGEGMDEGIIDRYLLTLFRSTKEDDLTKIGKFGVGFVSVFALEPDLLVLDTGHGSESWRLIFHPDRSFEKLRLDEPVEGTSIALYKRVGAEEFADLRERGAATVGYWCKYAEAEILVDGEPVAEAFALDAHLAVRYQEPGTEILIGFAPPKRAVDAERRRLSGVEAATALAPLVGFYNRGLTLVETSEPPNAGSREAAVLAGLSFRVKSRYLEHTLTRDDVRQDENYAKVMKLLRAQIEGALRARLVAHLEALAGYRCGVRDEAPGGPTLEMALLYARLPSMRLHESAPGAAIMPTVAGQAVSVATLREVRTPTGSVLFAGERSPLTALLHERRVPVVMGDTSLAEHLIAIGAHEVGAFELDRVLVTAARVAVDEGERACLERVRELLVRAKVKVTRVELGDLAYPGSILGTDLYLRQERAFDITQRGRDDQVTWLGGARDLVFNRSHELVGHAMGLCGARPELAAQLLAQAVCMVEDADGDRAVGLTRAALGLRGKGRG